MNIRLLIPLLLLTYTASWAQSRIVKEIPEGVIQAGSTYESAIDLVDVTPFLAYSLTWKGDSEGIQIRWSADGAQWSSWLEVHIDGHATATEKHISELMYTQPEHQFFQIQQLSQTINTIRLHLFNPGESPAITPGKPSLMMRSSCPCNQPAFVDRGSWCPAGNCPPISDPTFTNPTHIIVHHSAGTNVSSDWGAVVRSIWDFHVNVNGWSDIGYNWLVDPNGMIYIGRGENIQGAHFCGTNASTTGICVLGNFQTMPPSDDAIAALSEFLAWKTCDINVDPLGSAPHSGSGLLLNRISGHRDGCSTACPGDSFYPLLPDVRNQTVDYISSACGALAGPTNLQGNTVSSTQVNLQWQDNSTDETAFSLERSQTTGDNYTEIANLPPNTTTYEDMGLTPNTLYLYRVRAFNEVDTSAYSNEIFITTVFSSTSSLFNKETLELFPNPTSGQLQLRIQNDLIGTIDLQLKNLLGQVMQNTIVLNKETTQAIFDLDVSRLPAGQYLLELRHNNEVGAMKFEKF